MNQKSQPKMSQHCKSASRLPPPTGTGEPNRKRQILISTIHTSLVIFLASSINSAGAFYHSSSSASSLPVRVSPNDPGVSDAFNASLTQTVSHKSPVHGRQFGDMVSDIQIECNSDNIVITLTTNHGFNGMIYPKGLSKNSTCMTEYHQTSANITYFLPLRSCNTMSSDVEDGVEYFNTVMIQPHRRLVTNQGRGYHIRCRYQTKERTITNLDQQLNVNLTQITPAVIGSATMPLCTMKIYSSGDLSHEVAAENVRIGDELQLVISLDDQDVYGMMVTNCLVRDGMNWGEQPLIDDFGCPIDEDIMPQFVYARNLTRASVTFQAHKFPYTSSVYYQCNVRLCFREGGCQSVPPNCDKRFSQAYKTIDGTNEISRPLASSTGAGGAGGVGGVAGPGGRHKRWLDGGELDAVASEDLLKSHNSETNKRDLSIEVFSGLHVDESNLESSDTSNKDSLIEDPLMMASTNDDPSETIAANGPESAGADPQASRGTESTATKDSKQSEKDFCMSMRKFAIAISLISLLLMLLVIIMMACLIHRRKKLRESQRQGMSIYQQQQQHHQTPYHSSNYGYCRE